MNEAENLYNQIKNSNLIFLHEQFPDESDFYEKNNFDWTTLLFRNGNKKDQKKTLMKNATAAVSEMFSFENIEKFGENKKSEAAEKLQEVFFYFLKDISQKADDKIVLKLCENAEKDDSWKTEEKQCEILNQLCENKGNFCKKNPFTVEMLDFSSYQTGYENILRLLHNFSGDIEKENVIDELNFVREQQKKIIPCVVNQRKTNYSKYDADNEIKLKNKNQKLLSKIDSGFKVENYGQTICGDNQKLKMDFSRNLTCKMFRESDFVWDVKPYFSRGRILCRKSERAMNKNSFSRKYLYQERNIFTHSGENSAIYGLFTKPDKKVKKEDWERLFLESLYDAREFLLKNHHQSTADVLLTMLNWYFEKIVAEIKPENWNGDTNQLWNYVFDEEGTYRLDDSLLEKTDIFNKNLLKDFELEQLKGLLTFLYCSSHENLDFITENKIQIVLYTIYMSLSLSKLEVNC